MSADTDTPAKSARITGTVEYREGDGAMITIPRGPCEVREAEQDVTISWAEGDTRGSTAIPKADFDRYVKRRSIEID